MALAEAKARISELVDQAEHHGKRTLILRHGKPAAALVPIELAAPPRRPAKRVPKKTVERSIAAFIDEFSAAESAVSAVEDLITGRR
jgi:prevent-host-death family protein